MPDDISTENVKNLSEEKRADRRRFLKYSGGAVLLAAAAAAGYYALTLASAPAPTTTAAKTTPVTPAASLSPLPATRSTAEIHTGLKVTSQAFGNGGRIPSKYACDGENISPPVSWSGAPEETRSYGLVMDDLDAPMGAFTHWVIFNVPAMESGLEENVPAVGTLYNGAIQGRNGFGKIGYDGPCPPSGTHRYVLHLYALNTLLNLQPGASKQDVLKAMEGHILAEAEFAGLYSRS